MRRIGFSTGALALGDFRRALNMLKGRPIDAVELSALRVYELPDLVRSFDGLDLSQFTYVSVHAPSRFSEAEECDVVNQLRVFLRVRWPIVLHPDAIHNYQMWEEFGDLLCIENMDKRKHIGRYERELEYIFERLPNARLCFDMAHARQVDSSMTEAYTILRNFGHRLLQLHISEVNTSSKHDHISQGASRAFKEIAHLIPPNVPAILETPVLEEEIEEELARALDSLTSEPVLTT
jgi:hypothetical protein